DLCLENDNRVFVQPLVNESPEDVLGILKHPRTLATFSDSGAHVCQEMGSSLQTHLLSYWVRKRQQFTLEEAVRMLTFDNASAWELPQRCALGPSLSPQAGRGFCDGTTQTPSPRLRGEGWGEGRQTNSLRMKPVRCAAPAIRNCASWPARMKRAPIST